MRIAIFSDSLLPVLNGVSVSVDSLVTELRNQGHSVHLFGPQARGHREDDPNVHRFRAFEMPQSRGFSIAYPPFIRLLRQFRKQEFDVIHCHTIGVIGFVGLRWAQSHEIPIVATYHTLYDRYAHYFNILPRRYVRFKIAKHTNFFFNHVDQAITPSEASMRWLRRHSVNAPITVIPTGTRRGPLRDRFAEREALGIPPGHRIMLFVGRLAKEKNMETLFQAAAIAMAKCPELRLWIVGDGPYRDDCHFMARELNIGDRVRFFGFIERTDVERYYAAADMFVFASTTETQGLVVQEAMAYGLPPVLVDGGGASAGLTNNENSLLTRNDPVALAEAIEKLNSNDELYSHLSLNARRLVRLATPETMTRAVLEVYQLAILGKHVQAENSFAEI